MASTPQSLTQFDNWLKEKYMGGAWQEAFYRSNVLLNRLKKKTLKLEGKKFVIPVHAGRSRTTAGRAEGADLPEARPQTVEQFTLTPVSLYHPIEVTGQAIDMTETEAAAFANALDFEMKNAKLDFGETVDMQLFGDGTGAIAHVSAVGSASTTVTVADTMYLEAGMPISIATTTGSVITNGAQDIVSVDHDANTFTVGTAITTGTTHYVYPGSGDTAGSAPSARGVAIGGLQRVVDDSAAYGGVTRSGNVWSQGNVIDGSDGLNEDLILRAKNTSLLRGGGKTSLIITNEEQWRDFGLYIFGPRVWVNNVKVMDGGFQYIDFQGTRITWDKYCPRSKMYLIDESTMYFGQVKPLGFMDHDGRTLVRHATKDQYKAMLVWRTELCCTNPPANTVIENLPTGNGITG